MRWLLVALVCAGSSSFSLAQDKPGEILYNGIQLPAVWPPRLEKLTREPMPLPYLKSPPKVIPIDIGRQLFIDDFLIEKTTLARVWHAARYYEKNPVLRPDEPWEMTGNSPTAMVFSDGVFFDPADQLFKMWYMGGYCAATCLATSRDGIRWDKPAFDIKPGTNIVQPDSRDSATVWLDLDDKDPARRYKLFRVGKGWIIHLYFSADGIHWGEPVAKCPQHGDRSTVFYNPFRKVWVWSLRNSYAGARARKYREHPDALAGSNWKPDEAVWWTQADDLDPMRDDLKIKTQLYNLDAFAYESVMVGLFSIWRGQPKDRPKPNEVLIGFSRDGFHWDRANRAPFIPVSEHFLDWNWGNVQSCSNGCIVVGDQLYFYVSGRQGFGRTATSGNCSTGLALLRRDGFASMESVAQPSDAPPGEPGELTTRPVLFTGKHLFVNLDAPRGQLKAEILDGRGNPIPPFTSDNCAPVSADSTKARVAWRGADDLSQVAGKPVRFRFQLRDGKLYSFWVSPDPSGPSRGHLAGGGPGLKGNKDD